MASVTLTKAEALELVLAGADNVMVQYVNCDDEECGCTPKKPCWIGIQKGDEEDGGWPEHWKTFELWN